MTKNKYKNKNLNNNNNIEKKNSNIDFNIIYLIDITASMKKYSNIIDSISTINKKLLDYFNYIKIGYVLYKDFENFSYYNENNDHIKVYPPSKLNINIPKDIEFSGGNDYAEDWANSINEVSKLINEKNSQNIVIHLCDSNAHGQKFSDYDLDTNSQEEYLLIEALNQCKIKNIKFIGFLFNNYARKSFLECQKIYTNLSGYYDLEDLTRNELNPNNFSNIVIDKIKNLSKNNFIINKYNFDNYSIDESDFSFKDLKEKIKMLPLYETFENKNKHFKFLPEKIKKNNRDYNFYIDEKNGIEQGYIGDCYLISSILSMLSKFPLIFKYIFPNYLNYNERTKIIEMYIYENGIKKLISFKNTYATYYKQLIFSKPLNNDLCGICLEKGYAVSKCVNNEIKTGYEKIIGGSGYQVFESILGAECEKFVSHKQYLEENEGYKCINKETLKDKIKKYIDFGGLITFGIYYNIKGAHEYSLQGYKINKNGQLIIEIINPHRSGEYEKENIYYGENKEELNKCVKNYPIIGEEDFISKECRQSLYNYENTGYLLMEFETFAKWYCTIDMCDPMFGSFEKVVEYIPNGEKIKIFNFIINKRTKFKACIFTEERSKLNIENYIIRLKNEKGNIVYNEHIENNNKLIYEILERGFYSIEISNDNSELEIKDIIYLKLQYYERIEFKTKVENGILNIGYNCLETYKEIKFITEFIYKFLKFTQNNNIELLNKSPSKKSVYYREVEVSYNNGIFSLPNFYIDYNNILNGFYFEVIYKYKWQPFFELKYQYDYNDYYHISTQKGEFKTTKDFYFYGFDNKFKNNLFINIQYKEPIFWKQIINNPNSHNKIPKNFDDPFFRKDISNLKVSKINLINIEGASCYQSATIQGIIHIIIPIAIKKYNKKRGQSGMPKIDDFDELKNNKEFNDLIIEILKIICKLEEEGERTGKKAYQALDLFKKFQPEEGFHEGLRNIFDCNKLHDYLIHNCILSNPSLSNNNGMHKNKSNMQDENIDKDSIKIIYLDKNTIISDVMKIKIEGNLRYCCNLVLKLNENNLNDNNLNIYKLLKNCPQLKNNNNSQRKIDEISEIIYICIDRISKGEVINKLFNIDEYIYFDKVNKTFTQSLNNQIIKYELKFIMYHSTLDLYSGHFFSYIKIMEDWYKFDDINYYDYANKENPPLNNDGYIYPIILYYVRKDK